MTTHRRYAFSHPHPHREGHQLVQQVLERACELHWWYRDPEVTGLPFGRLAFAFTVSGRDRWWTHQRALKLATDVYYVLGMTERDVPEPDWEPLAPHANRGRWRVPAAST
jgi:hypothetical protein